MVKNSSLITPVQDILLGVTRNKICKIASSIGLSVEEREISRTELKTADEIFISGAIKGLVPIRKWNDWQNKKGFEICDLLRKEL